MKPALMLELMPTIRGTTLLETASKRLSTAFTTTPQSTTSIVLISGVSGVGKTKVAYDIGLQLAYVVISRVVEHDAPTPPWLSFFSFANEVSRVYSPARLPLAERVALKAAIIVLLGAHLEWVVSISEAALSGFCHQDLAAAEYFVSSNAASTDIAAISANARAANVRELVLRQLVLRSQRNGLAYRHVSRLFNIALRSQLSKTDALNPDGILQLPITGAIDYLLGVVKRASCIWRRLDCTADEPVARIVWAHDEVQALLDSAVTNLSSDIFDGVYSRLHDAAEEGTVHRGCFYGLLAAVREVLDVLHSGHLLLGTSLDMSAELLNEHSPAQGMSCAFPVAVHLDTAMMRDWLALFLSPAALEGVTDEALSLLRGRPLFVSLFWTMLVSGCGNPTFNQRLPAERVRLALTCAYDAATEAAFGRMTKLWKRYSPEAQGNVPSRLMRFLFHELTMASGDKACWRDMHLHDGVKECIKRGILNTSDTEDDLFLDAEPSMARALVRLGEQHVRDGDDGILALLAARVTDPGGGEGADYGPAQEACFSWLLVRACMETRINGRPPLVLGELLERFLARDDCMLSDTDCIHGDLLPQELNELEVTLDHGHRGDNYTWRCRCPLSILIDDPTTLVHHPPNHMGGPDIMFLARNRRTRAFRLIVLQLKNRTSGSLADALRSVDLGTCHSDCRGEESFSHRDMRIVLAENPSWALPIRCVVDARPVSRGAMLDVAWLNDTMLSGSPVLFLRLTDRSIGARICPPGAVAEYDRISSWPQALWPTPMRHWGEASPLPSLNACIACDKPIASLRVCFEAVATHVDIMVAVDIMAHALGGTVAWVKHRWFLLGPHRTTATFSRAATAFSALRAAMAGRLTVSSGAPITAKFV